MKHNPDRSDPRVCASREPKPERGELVPDHNPRCGGRKQTAESTAGMIPGNRGMGRSNWCRVSPDGGADKTADRRAYITSSSGRSRVRLVHESGTVRRGVIRNHAEPS
jgi:hypothetical protein